MKTIEWLVELKTIRPRTNWDIPKVYTNDKDDILFRFRLIDTPAGDLDGTLPLVQLWMQDGSYFESSAVTRENESYLYRLPKEQGLHSGINQIQLIVKYPGDNAKDFATTKYQFEIERGLDDQVHHEVIIPQYNDLMDKWDSMMDQSLPYFEAAESLGAEKTPVVSSVVNVMPKTLGTLGDFYDPVSGKKVNTPATQTFKPTGNISTSGFNEFNSKGVASWVFYKTNGERNGAREFGGSEVPVSTVVTIPEGTAYMIGNIKDQYFPENDPDKSAYWYFSATATYENTYFKYKLPGLLVDEDNLGDKIIEAIEGSASNGLARAYKDTLVLNFGDSIIESKNPSISELFSGYTGANAVNVGFGGCMMCPHPNVDFAAFSMSNLVDAIETNNYSRQKAALSGSGIPASFTDTLDRLMGVDWTKVKAITISYGTNDWLNSNKLDNPNDKYDKTYYLGALRYSVRKIQQTYKHVKIVVSPPIFRSTNDRTENATNWKNANTQYLRDYADGVYKAAKEMSILSSDTFYGLGINQFNEREYFPDNDGTHPNAKGKALLAAKLAETTVYGASATPDVDAVERRVDDVEVSSSEGLDEHDGRITELENDVVVSATNLIQNGDFRDGVTGWASNGGVNTSIYDSELKRNVAELKGINSNYPGLRQIVPFTEGHKVYLSTLAKRVSGDGVGLSRPYFGFIQNGLGTYFESTTYTRVSLLVTLSGTNTNVYIMSSNGQNSNAVVRATDILMIDLTETFGAGNEPTKEQMDKLLSQFPNSWFDGKENLFQAKTALDSMLKNDKVLNVAATNLFPQKTIEVNTYGYSTQINITLAKNHTYYTRRTFEVLNGTANTVTGRVSVLGSGTNLINGSEVSQTSTHKGETVTNLVYLYGPNVADANGIFKSKFDNILIIDLTETFGTGNEPTKEQMDRLLTQFPNSWFEGTENLFHAKLALESMLKNDKALNVAATNLIKNGNFDDGLTNWVGGNSTLLIENGALKLTSTGEYGRITQSIPQVNVGEIIYVSVNINENEKTENLYFGVAKQEVYSYLNNFNNSYVRTITTASTQFVVGSRKAGEVFHMDHIFLINLTKTFGAGNEPTKEQVDRLLTQFPNSWFDGTQNLFLARWALNELRRLDNEKANKKQEDWITLTTFNGVTSDPNYPAQFMKDDFGFVHLRGKIKNLNTGSIVFKLPAGYQAQMSSAVQYIRFVLMRNDASNVTAMQMNYVGDVYINVPNNDFWVYLDGVNFYAGRS